MNKIKESPAVLESNSIVFAGPFMGEFGWELSHWAPHVRWLRAQYKGKKLITASYPGRHPLYYNSVDEFWTLPSWFTDKKYDCDCFEALSEDGHYAQLIEYFKEKLLKKYAPENLVWTKTPRGFNKVLRQNNHVIFQKLIFTSSAGKTCREMIENHGNKPVVILFARAMSRKMFLDINHNQPAYVEDLPDGLPTRNWPRSHWEDLFESLYARYAKQITFVIGGTKGGSCLLDMGKKYPDVIDLTSTPVNESLDLTIAFLNHALCSVSSQSGPSHLSVQCGCPSFIYGDQQQRHVVDDNPLKTDVAFMTTQPGLYNDTPEDMFNEVSAYINELMNEKGLTQKRVPLVRKNNKVRKIGMVGVFDNPDSTNIPFGKAFVNANMSVDVFNYRTVAAQAGIPKMNTEIVKFAANYDLIIFCKANGITPETIAACSRITRTLWYMMDGIRHLNHDKTYYDIARSTSFNVVTTRAVADALLEAGIQNVHHIIQGVDPKQFHPIEGIQKEHDVVFIGQKTEKREKIINKLLSTDISVKCYGPGWGEEAYGEHFNRACAEGRILLGINNSEPNYDNFSDRIIRYMATCGCVVTEYSKGLEKYFNSHETTMGELYWPVEEESFSDLIKLLLGRPSNIAATAEAGYQRVLKDYTWDAVAKKTISIFNEKKQDQEVKEKISDRLKFIRQTKDKHPDFVEPKIITGKNVYIHPTAVIGSDGFGYERNEKGELEKFPHIGGVVIGDNVDIRAHACIDRGTINDTVIGEGTKINNLAHVGHNVTIGKHCLIGVQSVIAGSAIVGDYVYIAPGALIRNKIKIGDRAFIGLGTVVTKDVPSNTVVVGNPAREINEFKKSLQFIRRGIKNEL